MNLSPSRRHTILAAAVAAVLALGAIVPAQAQSTADRASQRRAERQGGKKADDVQKYPNAARKSPDGRPSGKASPKLQKMTKLFDDEKGAEARALGDEIIANEGFNAYDRAFAARVAGQIAYEGDDFAGAADYWNKALTFDGLNNNDHFDLMYNLAIVQLNNEKPAEALAMIDRMIKESGSTNPDHLALKGALLYDLDRHEESAAIFKQLVESTPEPKADWLQRLMFSYNELGKTGEAVKLAEQIAAKKPTDKQAQMNLAAVYTQADMNEKAVATLEKMRAAGQLTEDRDYRVLYGAYLGLDNKEKEVIAVIEDGLQKGILKPDHQAYLALAQSYYYSEQIAPAIENFRKAAPLAKDGETYLNLARLFWQEDRIAEAKEAAKQALAKGLKKPEDAKKILALPAK